MTTYTNLAYICFLPDDGPERGETKRSLYIVYNDNTDKPSIRALC